MFYIAYVPKIFSQSCLVLSLLSVDTRYNTQYLYQWVHRALAAVVPIHHACALAPLDQKHIIPRDRYLCRTQIGSGLFESD
jgi:hypothetical protein